VNETYIENIQQLIKEQLSISDEYDFELVIKKIIADSKLTVMDFMIRQSNLGHPITTPADIEDVFMLLEVKDQRNIEPILNQEDVDELLSSDLQKV